MPLKTKEKRQWIRTLRSIWHEVDYWDFGVGFPSYKCKCGLEIWEYEVYKTRKTKPIDNLCKRCQKARS